MGNYMVATDIISLSGSAIVIRRVHVITCIAEQICRNETITLHNNKLKGDNVALLYDIWLYIIIATAKIVRHILTVCHSVIKDLVVKMVVGDSYS